MKQMTIEELRAARARAKAKGTYLIKALSGAPMTAGRRAKLRDAARRGAAARRAQGDATFGLLLSLAADGVSLQQAMAETGLSENGVRKNLRDRLGTGAWPPKTGDQSNA